MKPMTADEVERILKAHGRPHHGNRPIRQGTLHSIFRLAGIPPPR